MCDQTGLDQEFKQKLPELEWNICYLPINEKAVYEAWITKLKGANTTLNESRLRNDILCYLIDRTQAGSNFVVPEPFNTTPKEVPLTDGTWKFPRNMKARCPRAEDRNNLLEMFRCSPDRGAFLADQPVPKTGTFGFMIFRKPPKSIP